MKWINRFSLLLISSAMQSCFGQDTIPNTVKMPKILEQKLDLSPFMDYGPSLGSALQNPDFLVKSYAFYPKLKKIAYLKNFVHKMSSSGYGRLYYDEIKGVDYDSFEIINSDYAFARDKNEYYLQGAALNIIPSTNRKIFVDDYYRNIRIVSADNTIVLQPGVNKVDRYVGYKPIGDVVYQKDDSVFLFDGEKMKYIQNPNFDAPSLKKLENQLYQDQKNLYRIYEDKIFKINDEQIVDRYIFKNIENRADNMITIYVGTKNFYIGNGTLFNYKLQNYHFIPNSNFYVYNSCLYFMDGFDYNPVGVSSKTVLGFNEFEAGLNEPEAIRVDYTKARTLSNDILVYDNKRLFKENDEIAVNPKINLTNLKYAGFLPDDLEKMVENQFERQYFFYKDLFEYNGDYYVIYRDSLTKVTRNKAKLSSFKWFNEYYYTYQGTLFGHIDFRYPYSKTEVRLTNKTIDFNKLKVFGKYFTNGDDIWYSYKKTDQTTNEIKISPKYNFRAYSPPLAIKTLNKEIPKIAFGKLQEIENTEFITDGIYLLFRGNVIGKIDFKSLKILGKNYVEDANQYFYESFAIAKKDLKN